MIVVKLKRQDAQLVEQLGAQAVHCLVGDPVREVGQQPAKQRSSRIDCSQRADNRQE
ncbi:hypothetical protein D3C72_2536680 [compost metagenome]